MHVEARSCAAVFWPQRTAWVSESLVDFVAIELDALAEVVPSARVIGSGAVGVHDVAYDHRTVSPGSVFACIRGEVADGHDFAGQAVNAGAVALLVERELPVEVPQLVVDDARASLGTVADAVFRAPSAELTVVGVTGTNGKTTTTFLLHAILAAAGRRPGLLGTIERRIGGERWASRLTTAESADIQRDLRAMLDAGDDSCVMEVSSHAIELGRLQGVRFDAAVFTNLGSDHLDFHGDEEAYFAAKRRLFTDLDPDGRRPPAVVNVDDPWGQRLTNELIELGEQPVTFGRNPAVDVAVRDLRVDGGGISFASDGLELESRLRGDFNAQNILAAVATGRFLGLDDQGIARGVQHLRGVPGRFETLDLGQPFVVIIDYAHTPEALDNVLRAARPLTEQSLTCVFGCGGDRDKGKRAPMGAAATAHADAVVITSDNPRSEDPATIAAEIVEGAGRGARVELDRAAAIELAFRSAENDDVVVIAGKGHEQGQEVAGRVIPFDDREVASHILQRLLAEVSG